jgi:hypothetical protein
MKEVLFISGYLNLFFCTYFTPCIHTKSRIRPNAAADAENTNLRLSSSPRCLLPVDSIKINGDKHDK